MKVSKNKLDNEEVWITVGFVFLGLLFLTAMSALVVGLTLVTHGWILLLLVPLAAVYGIARFTRLGEKLYDWL